MKETFALALLLSIFGPTLTVSQLTHSPPSGTNEDGQTRFLKLVGMTNYIEKLKKDAARGIFPFPIEALSTGNFQKAFRPGATKEFGWVWKPKDPKVLGLSVDEIYRVCGTPDRELSNKVSAAWGHVGYLSEDGKKLSQLIVYPFISERDEVFKKNQEKP